MAIVSNILPRRLWNALAAKYAFNLPVYPVPVVYIHHIASALPLNLKDLDNDGTPDVEEALWRSVQRDHMTSRGWSDIAYNFGVGLSGRVIEGRGWRRQGGATGNPDDRNSLSICAIGNFQTQRPTDDMLNAIVNWIVTGIELGHIREDVVIKGHQDKPFATACPGRYLYSHLPRIRSEVADRRLHREELVEGPVESWYTHLRKAVDGTRDEAVRVWQIALWQRGLLPADQVDGVLGPRTRAAHTRWEQDTYGASAADDKPGRVSWPVLLQPVVREVPTKPDTTRLVNLAESVASVANAVRDEARKI